MSTSWDWSFAGRILPELFRGLGVTVEITAIASTIAMTLGLAFAIIRYSGVPVVSHLVTLFVEFVRGTPLLVQAYFAFYVLPKYGLRYSPLVTGVFVLGINYSSYTAEVYRAGIEGVPRGQWEAAIALSLPWRRRWQKIVLPQAIRAVIPALGNYVIAMFKDSAILSAITVFELLNHATAIGSANFRYLEPLTLAGLLYLLVSYPSAWFIRRLEARLAQPH
jgi:polar amino acid transport system permease protein